MQLEAPITERDTLIETVGATVVYPQQPVFVHIERHALETPNQVAVRFEGQCLTYQHLNRRANQLAHYLISRGLQPGQPVGLCLHPSLDIAPCLLAILKAGGVYVPLDPTHPPERLAVILADTQAQFVLSLAELAATFSPMVEHTIALDTEADTLATCDTSNPQLDLDLDQTAYIIYTSGTTGKPKGIMATHRNLINYLLATRDRFGFCPDDVMPAIARLTFSISLFEVLSPLVAGATLMVLSRQHILDPKRMADTLAELTMIHTVPSLMQKLLLYIQDHHLDLQRFHRMKYAFTGGDTVKPELLELLKAVFQKAQVYVLYGCSEVSSLCCSYPVSRQHPVEKTLIGKPFNNVTVRLYDAEQNPAPLGTIGEIYVTGNGITAGYLNRPELTREKFIAIDGQRFYKTGDLGRFHPTGDLEFLGRSDFQINLRGIRMEPSEIESVLRQAPAVTDAVVMGRPLWNGEPAIVAYLVLQSSEPNQLEHIRNFLKPKLPDYMLPSAYVLLDAMPLNVNQKVDRNALPEPTPDASINQNTFVAPETETEHTLARIWSQILKIEKVSIDDNFFDLGGNSLLAMNILAEIEQVFARELSITSFYKAPTIRTLARIVDNKELHETSESLMVIQPKGSKPPLFCIHVLGRGLGFYRPLVSQLKHDRPVYGLTVQFLEKEKTPENRVEDLAAYYINEIRSIQPEGPYFLSGVSFGGIVAFEIARQLHLQGQKVQLLAMLDTYSPNAFNSLSKNEKISAHWDEFSKNGLSYILKKTASKLSSQLSSLRKFLNLSWREMAIKYYMTCGLTLPERLSDYVFQKEHKEASKLYKPQAYDGDIILFRAIDLLNMLGAGAGVQLDPKLGWGSFTTGEVKVFDIPGDHLGILKEPGVQVLAKHFQTFL